MGKEEQHFHHSKRSNDEVLPFLNKDEHTPCTFASGKKHEDGHLAWVHMTFLSLIVNDFNCL